MMLFELATASLLASMIAYAISLVCAAAYVGKCRRKSLVGQTVQDAKAHLSSTIRDCAGWVSTFSLFNLVLIAACWVFGSAVVAQSVTPMMERTIAAFVAMTVVSHFLCVFFSAFVKGDSMHNTLVAAAKALPRKQFLFCIILIVFYVLTTF